MSEAVALGAPIPIEFEGKTYMLSPFKNKLVGYYESWLKAQAWKEVEEDRPLMEAGVIAPHVYQERHREVSRLIAGKDYKRGGSIFQTSLSTEEGFKQVAFLMLRDNDQTVTPELVERMYEAIPEQLIARVQDLMTDPNLRKGTAPKA